MVGTSNQSVPEMVNIHIYIYTVYINMAYIPTYKVWGVTHNGASAIEEFPRNIDSVCPEKIC